MSKLTPATPQQEKKTSTLKGVVVSVKMAQTIVVEVETLKTHPKYLKKYRSTKRYIEMKGDWELFPPPTHLLSGIASLQIEVGQLLQK